jgi:RsiW-degrading membrane proteinase PrsW (M82 family)
VLLKYHGAMQIISLALATIIPIVFLYFLYTMDFYGTGSYQTVLLCFAWGFVAFGLAYAISQVAVYGGAYLISGDAWVRFAAPVAEEILKALILIYLVRRSNFTYFVDGAIYGFAAGIGFAVIENWSYVASYGEAGLGVAIGRVLSTNLVHGTASALVGITLGSSRFQKFRGRIALLLLGWAVGMTLHIGFNNLVSSQAAGSFLLLYAAAVGFIGTGFIAFMINRGLKEQKAWIEETLSKSGEEFRVTQGEAAVVNRLSDIEELLQPIALQFGDEKAKQCERFLFLQARMSIKQKTLEKLTDENMKRAVEAEIVQLRTEMDEARRSVGAYCMLYIRNIFPQDTSPIWNQLQRAIDDKIQARPATGGANLWATLGDRASQTVSPQEKES